MNKLPALPIIQVIKTGRNFKVDWDYQEAPESRILGDRESYLRPYINGVMDGLGIRPLSIRCASGRTGTVVKLDEGTAQKLARLLEELLFPIVSAEHKRLKREAKLPPQLRSDYRPFTDD